VTTATATTTLTYRIHIKASPQEVWDALTTRGEEYGYHAPVEYDLEAGTYRSFPNAGMREAGMCGDCAKSNSSSVFTAGKRAS
jgi:hypothetical protein